MTMMKRITLIALVLCSFNALADDTKSNCLDKNGNDMLSNPDAFIAAIAAESTCYEAQNLAAACAWGSSMDVRTAGTAYQVCKKELDAEKPSDADLAILKSMEDKCEARYSNEEGTLYMAENAFCHLSAIEWLDSVDASDQN